MFGERGRSNIIIVASVVESSGGFLCDDRHFICVVDAWGGIVMVST